MSNKKGLEKMKIDFEKLKLKLTPTERKVLGKIALKMSTELKKIQNAQAELYHEIENMKEEHKELKIENRELKEQLKRRHN